MNDNYNPNLDPVWQRAVEMTIAALCIKINAILDGKADGSDVHSEPWRSTCRRLASLAKEQRWHR